MQKRLFILIFSLLPSICLASKTPVNSWEMVLSKISYSLTGPVAYFIAVISIAVCGVMVIFTDIQNGGRRFVVTGCGIMMIATAASITTNFLGFSGALI